MSREVAAVALSTYYLGTHEPAWLPRTRTPLFISYHRLSRRRSLPRALGRWALDSGGFSELSLRGTWTVEPARYAAAAERWQAAIGGLDWAATQDWMCEPPILARTGLNVQEHQRRTVDSYLTLRQLAPGVPWAPVLQGWRRADYLRCAAMYELSGVRLAMLPAVGVGSVCRRQGSSEVDVICRDLAAALPGARLHLFGVKTRGLPALAPLIASADSMAWSLDARRLGRAWCGSATHRTCANCRVYAEHWRRRVLTSLRRA